jgi:PEP-CTERM motif
MNRYFALVAIGITLAVTAAPVRASVITYANRSAFNAAAPGAPVEGFQGANTSATSGFTGPLSSTSNNGVFSPGAILPGITISTNSNDMFLAGPGQSSNPTLAVGSNFPPTDALNLQFAPGVTAVAFDLFQNFGGGAQSGSPQTYTVSLFDSSNASLGVFTTTVPSGGAGFFGATSTTAIGSVSILGPQGAFEVIDNIAFGRAAAVPEPATLVVFGTLALGAFGVRRRVKATA